MMFRKRLENINSYKPGKPVEEVKRALGLTQVYKLASNEIPFAPAYINRAIQKELKNINRYPESGCFYLRKAVAAKLKVREDQIVFGNGSDEIITLALRVLIEEGDEVIVGYPTFLIYEIQAKIEGAEVVRAPLRNFRYCLDDIAAKITARTKIIFIANPDNPTGTYLNNKEIENFLSRIPASVLVFFDEAYFEFAPPDFPKTIRFLKERGNIIFTRTFSKAFGLAGARIGYGVTTPSIASFLNKVREPFNVNRFAQVAAVAAVNNGKFLNKVVTYIKREKQYLYKELKAHDISFIKSATNFVLIDFRKDTASLYNYLLKNGIIVRELAGWGLPNLCRVTVGLHKENKKFIDCFKRYLNK
ncbi:MAG: histidinol-phosphate transaminase [Candidatus Omnitrophota bacterium]|nr:MAG: histidinol-phosphate transaminase [Candidatus Omnitrophota bacterium]